MREIPLTQSDQFYLDIRIFDYNRFEGLHELIEEKN